MKDERQKGKKQMGVNKPDENAMLDVLEKRHDDITVDPELEKFSSAYFAPEKYKEDGIRLAKSTLPSFK